MIIARDKNTPSTKTLSELEFVDAQMLHPNSYGINPLNAYSSPEFVLSGDSEDNQGMIIDAVIA